MGLRVEHDTVEALRSFIRKLNDESSNGALVIVEGPRDARALKAIGFKGEIATLSSSGRLSNLVEKAKKYRRMILLFDLDHEGRVLTKKASLILEGKRFTIDLYFRRHLAYATRGRVDHVEELVRYKEHLANYP